MLIYFFFIFSAYYVFCGLLIYGWNKSTYKKPIIKPSPIPYISVVVAVRNEEQNIDKLLSCLSHQSLEQTMYEVIIVDDYSDDKTASIVHDFMDSERFSLQLIKSDYDENHSISPKKLALSKGIVKAKGEIIVMTDGDCWFGKNWLQSISSAFVNDETKFVSGPVVLKGNESLLSKFQTIEFASLIGSGGAMIGLNYPLMCNGANLAFRKSAFDHVNGYDGNEKNSSGDDVFLMQKIHLAYKKSIVFMKDEGAIVYTKPLKNISDLNNQRKRWASKWNKYLLPLSWALPVFLFVHYASFVASIIYAIFMPKVLMLIGLLISIRFVLDYIFLRKTVVFLKIKMNFLTFLLIELLYPFYTLFFGISIHFGNYSWKGRVHIK